MTSYESGAQRLPFRDFSALCTNQKGDFRWKHAGFVIMPKVSSLQFISCCTASAMHLVPSSIASLQPFGICHDMLNCIHLASHKRLLCTTYRLAQPCAHWGYTWPRLCPCVSTQSDTHQDSTLQVVEMIAAALEHAAKESSGDSQLAQANAQYAARPCDHDRPSASVVAQLVVVVAHGADQADVQAADSIALQVIILSLHPVSSRPFHCLSIDWLSIP